MDKPSPLILKNKQAMYYWNREGISVRVVLDKRKILKSGNYPIHIRVIYRRIIKDYATGRESSLSDWGKMENSNARRFLETRHYIKERFDKVIRILDELADR